MQPSVAITATQLGLEPGVAGMGELIPFKTKQGWVCQFMPGYKGLMDLARRSGQVGAINAECVHENDRFSYSLGTNPHIEHVPAGGDRGKVTHVYAAAHLVATNEWQFKVLTREDVEMVRKGSRSGNVGPWQSHWDEMAKKTAIRALCKLLPASIEVQKAVALDEMADAGVSQQNDSELPLDLNMDLKLDTQAEEVVEDGKAENA